MRALNLVLVVLTLLSSAGGYVQEKRRLARIRQLPPEKARALYEVAQRRRERLMIVITVALVAGAVAALASRVAP